MAADRFVALRGQIDLRQRALGRNAAGEKHCVCLGVAPLEGGGEDRSHHQAGSEAGVGAEKLRACPADADDGQSNAEHRNQAIDPDRRLRPLAAQRHRSSLQPVDADRLLVAGSVLETDVDIVAGLDHLLGGLDEAGFVAVDRRQAGQPANRHQDAEQKEDKVVPVHRFPDLIFGMAPSRPRSARCPCAGASLRQPGR